MSGAAAAGRGVPRGLAGAILPLALCAALLGLLATTPVLHVAANRLVVGTPVAAMQAFGVSGWIGVLLALAGAAAIALRRTPVVALAALVLLVAALLLIAADLGVAAEDLTRGQPPAIRARLATGAWLALALLVTLIAVAAGRAGRPGAAWLSFAAVGIGLALTAWLGGFDHLSLAVEYRARSASVNAALLRHVALSGISVALAALLCLLLAVWRRGRGIVDLAVSGIQVVPAVALLGALVALVSGLLAAVPSLRTIGLSALGPGPAVIAIAGYLLLPFWRGLHAALAAPDPAVLDAADAVGLTPRQTLLRVKLPLGLPILIGALRVASVQSIGLATLGALVGAGGLGAIVFDGMAQFAPDLILIGALPIIGLSLIAEQVLSLLEDRVRAGLAA